VCSPLSTVPGLDQLLAQSCLACKCSRSVLPEALSQRGMILRVVQYGQASSLC
jgi:hypothetical protein